MKVRFYKLSLFCLLSVAYLLCFVSIYLGLFAREPEWSLTVALLAATFLHFILHLSLR